MASSKLSRSVAVAVSIPLAIYIAHTLIMGSWIVDDAGISFAYARNLAEGYGLVAQPGADPVEGFTNLLWVLLLAIPLKFHAFDPVITPKLLSGICVTLSFISMGSLLKSSCDGSAWLTSSALAISALIPGFAIWNASGLENPLYILGLSLLAVNVSKRTGPGRRGLQRAIATGTILFLVFCTRPDGALYFWIPPFLLGLEKRSHNHRRSLAAYTAAFIIPWLLLTAFRLLYFHDVLPNTFYAKRGEGSAIFAWLLDHRPLFFAGIIMMVVGTAVITTIAFAVYQLGRKIQRRIPEESIPKHIPGLFLLTAIIVYAALRGDWMGEYRFATPAFLFGPATILLILREIYFRMRLKRALPLLVPLIPLLMIPVGILSFRHTLDYSKSPALSFASVREMSLRIANTLEIHGLGPDTTILTPDIGGALWENRFRVIDLVGLIDREMGRMAPRHRGRFRHYLLNVRKPDGIYLHEFWMKFTGIERNPVFIIMYLPLWEERDSPGLRPRAGFYLRRGLLEKENKYSSN